MAGNRGDYCHNNLPSDPEVSVLLHCAAWRGLLESQTQVELSERYNCQIDPALGCHIEKVWAERVSKEPWLFNGAKFRLHSFSLASPRPPRLSVHHPLNKTSCTVSPQTHSVDSASDKARRLCCSRRQGENMCEKDFGDRCGAGEWNSELEKATKHQRGDRDVDHFMTCPAARSEYQRGALEEPCPTSVCGGVKPDEQTKPLLTLRLGLTCYKDFLGTNWSLQAMELRRRGEMEFGDPLALLAQPLGVGGVLCTCDGQVVLIRRSQKVAEAGGLLDIPGGHPEPKAVCDRLGQILGEDQISVAILQDRQEAVVAELFSSVCAEIRDEVNVPMSSLGQPVLMGIALNHTSAGRPSAEFYISCSLTSAEVGELYWRGGPEAHESTDIVFLNKAEVIGLNRDSPLWPELCPSAKGAVLLYQLVKPD